MLSKFNDYLVGGILQANIVEDGGEQCYNQIPKDYHIIAIILFLSLNFFILKKYCGQLNNERKILPVSFLQKLMAVVNISSLSMTFYYKFITKRTVFMLNPCHITLLIQTVLLLSKNTPLMQKIHLSWTTWLFGAYLALLMPHLYGLSETQILVYYIEHLAIIPLGYLVLSRRYGFAKPTIMNQLVGFSSFAVYQLAVLAPVSILTKGNLNFALCHTPADPIYKMFGYHYFSIHNFTLNLASFILRWVSYLQVWFIIKVYRLFKSNENKKKQ